MSSKGLSRLTFIVALIAIALLLIIFVPIISSKINSKTEDVDTEQVIFAQRQAKVEYQTNHEAFRAVFDTETKKFVDEKTARTTVMPYGTAPENLGKYLLVTVDKSGNVTTEWIAPYTKDQ